MPNETRTTDRPGTLRVVLTGALTLALLALVFVAWPRPEAGLAKIGFDLSELDEEGLYGPPDGRRARDYELCVPNERAEEARAIDRTLRLARSPGRIGCGPGELLAIGTTGQRDWLRVLQRLSDLPWVRRIEPHYAE